VEKGEGTKRSRGKKSSRRVMIKKRERRLKRKLKKEERNM